VWTGIEYQVAAHMIYEGLVDEGLSIARGARDRYDGVPRPPIIRNPWCEIECGGHYTRAMSSWSLLLALSGFHFDTLSKTLRFAPACEPDNFNCFFSGPEGWGRLAQTASTANQTAEITVKSGRLDLKHLELVAVGKNMSDATAQLDGRIIPATLQEDGPNRIVRFQGDGLTIGSGNSLKVNLTAGRNI
jgi:hypothetical protein